MKPEVAFRAAEMKTQTCGSPVLLAHLRHVLRGQKAEAPDARARVLHHHHLPERIRLREDALAKLLTPPYTARTTGMRLQQLLTPDDQAPADEVGHQEPGEQQHDEARTAAPSPGSAEARTAPRGRYGRSGSSSSVRSMRCSMKLDHPDGGEDRQPDQDARDQIAPQR